MTAKEKARELFDRFKKNNKDTIFNAKKCALIAVEEILNNDGFTKFDDHLTDYWQQVKREIEKL